VVKIKSRKEVIRLFAVKYCSTYYKKYAMNRPGKEKKSTQIELLFGKFDQVSIYN